MKKVKKILLCSLLVLMLSGCSLFKDDLEDATVYTTVYPVKYIVNYLYGDHVKVLDSIYPSDCDIATYEVPSKKLSEYANADLFVYIDYNNEKNIAKDLLNKNEDLLIIDASKKASLENAETSLWLSPSNYLTLAKNIRDSLVENLNNTSLISEVDANYSEFEEKISVMDANLHSLGKTARLNGKNTLVVSSSGLKFLENYGFEVICLSDELGDSKLQNIKNNFYSKRYTNLLVLDTDSENELVKEILNTGANNVSVNSLTLSSQDYFSEMTYLLETIKNIVS